MDGACVLHKNAKLLRSRSETTIISCSFLRYLLAILYASAKTICAYRQYQTGIIFLERTRLKSISRVGIIQPLFLPGGGIIRRGNFSVLLIHHSFSSARLCNFSSRIMHRFPRSRTSLMPPQSIAKFRARAIMSSVAALQTVIVVIYVI